MEWAEGTRPIPPPGDDENKPPAVDGGIFYVELNLIFTPDEEKGWVHHEPKSCTGCGEVSIETLCLPCGSKDGDKWIVECHSCGKIFKSIRRNAATCSSECRAKNLRALDRRNRARQRKDMVFFPRANLLSMLKNLVNPESDLDD